MLYLANGHPVILTEELEKDQLYYQTQDPTKAPWPGLLIPEQSSPVLESLRQRIAARWGGEIETKRKRQRYQKSLFHYVLFPDRNYVDLHWLWPSSIKNGSPIVPFKNGNCHAAKAIFLLSRKMDPRLLLLQFKKLCGETGCVNPHHYLIFDTYLAKPDLSRQGEIIKQIHEYALIPKDEPRVEFEEVEETESSEDEEPETPEAKEERLLAAYISYNKKQLIALQAAAGGPEYIEKMEALKRAKLLREAETLPEPKLGGSNESP